MNSDERDNDLTKFFYFEKNCNHEGHLLREFICPDKKETMQ